jgi:uncharacterized GH25 family protein
MRAQSLFLVFTLALPAADRVTATGSVIDEATNQPISNATVMVYSAGVKKGYDQFCPTCYVDCGKRATTDEKGAFTIANLSGDLLFRLLVVHEGHSANFISKVDPAAGPSAPAKLRPRTSPADPSQIVRGRLIDNKERPVRDALVTQQGIIFADGRGFGDRGWIDLVAVTNTNGEFEMAYEKPAKSMILQIAPRGMAPKLVTLPTGAKPHAITATDGATIRGRLGHNGKPVANAEFGLKTHSQGAGTTFQEIRIGTNENGEFAITNVPAGRIWDLYATMDSLAPKQLAAKLTHVATKDDGQEIDIGEIAAAGSYSIKGRIVLSDGTPIPPNMRLNVFASRLPDRQTITLPADGTFEFKGLAKGVYVLGPAVKGYQPLDPEKPNEFLVEGDMKDFNVTLHPVPTPPTRK